MKPTTTDSTTKIPANQAAPESTIPISANGMEIIQKRILKIPQVTPTVNFVRDHIREQIPLKNSMVSSVNVITQITSFNMQI